MRVLMIPVLAFVVWFGSVERGQAGDRGAAYLGFRENVAQNVAVLDGNSPQCGRECGGKRRDSDQQTAISINRDALAEDESRYMLREIILFVLAMGCLATSYTLAIRARFGDHRRHERDAAGDSRPSLRQEIELGLQDVKDGRFSRRSVAEITADVLKRQKNADGGCGT